MITKAQVLHALRTEPLAAGEWFHPEKRNRRGDCAVCAVGAIVRSCLNTPVVASYTGFDPNFGGLAFALVGYNSEPSKGSYRKPLREKNYFLALSRLFELRARQRARALGKQIYDLTQTDIRPVRSELVQFVRAEFPESLPSPTVTLDRDLV